MKNHAKQVIHHLQYRFVWSTIGHRAVLTGPFAEEMRTQIRLYCERNVWTIITLEVHATPVELIVTASPSDAPSSIVNTLKGMSARQVFKQFPCLRQQVAGDALWEPGFLVVSVGQRDENMERTFLARA